VRERKINTTSNTADNISQKKSSGGKKNKYFSRVVRKQKWKWKYNSVTVFVIIFRKKCANMENKIVCISCYVELSSSDKIFSCNKRHNFCASCSKSLHLQCEVCFIATGFRGIFSHTNIYVCHFLLRFQSRNSITLGVCVHSMIQK
jgi:hypothetical protein